MRNLLIGASACFIGIMFVLPGIERHFKPPRELTFNERFPSIVRLNGGTKFDVRHAVIPSSLIKR